METGQRFERAFLSDSRLIAARQKLEKFDRRFNIAKAAPSQADVLPIVLMNGGVEQNAALQGLDARLVRLLQIAAEDPRLQ